MRKFVLLLPTYNEEENIEILLVDIFYNILQLKTWKAEVIVIDSHSGDNTQTLVKKQMKLHPNLHLLSVKKEGLGKAYILGYNYALKKFDPFAFIQMDADLSHEAKEIPHLLKAIEKGSDFVIGSRYVPLGSVPHEWARSRKIFSMIGNLVVRLGIFDLSIKDWTSGYRAVRAETVKKLPKTIDKYGGYIFMIAVLNSARLNKAKISEIPIKFQNRHGGISKLPASKYIVDVLKFVFLNSPLVVAFKQKET